VKSILKADEFESFGTIRFVNLFPLVAQAMTKGSVLVIDEFDSSLHPESIMSCINAFHSFYVNINHAQLIFNTHNAVLLNSHLFRRDEIKFTDRNEDASDSVSYSLSDIGYANEASAKKGEDYMINYFRGLYGAYRDIDLCSILEKIAGSEVEQNLCS
jgi:AAA15 family ATPase/GTPase